MAGGPDAWRPPPPKADRPAGRFDESNSDELDDGEGDLSRSSLAGAARGVTTIGPLAGRRLRRLVGEPPERAHHPPDSCRAAGFDLHVGRRICGADGERMERLSRCALRGPVVTERLTELKDGRLKYEFGHSWRDGTRAVLFEPLELIERLVALIPVQRRNLVTAHGTFASRAPGKAACPTHPFEGFDIDDEHTFAEDPEG